MRSLQKGSSQQKLSHVLTISQVEKLTLTENVAMLVQEIICSSSVEEAGRTMMTQFTQEMKT